MEASPQHIHLWKNHTLDLKVLVKESPMALPDIIWAESKILSSKQQPGHNLTKAEQIHIYARHSSCKALYGMQNENKSLISRPNLPILTLLSPLKVTF